MPDAGEPVAFHLIANGAYEPEVMEFIVKRMPLQGVFIDVGANVGAFALPIAKGIRPAGTVVAIEASPTVFPFLEMNCERNNALNVHCVHAAACAEAGVVGFFPAPADHFGMGSRAEQFSAAEVQVPAVTLDGVVRELALPRVDVIKIDVEGFEADVIAGAGQLCAREPAPVIVFEFCGWAEARVPGGRVGDAQRRLFDLGFSIWRLRDFACAGKQLRAPLEQGFAMLAATRARPASLGAPA